MNDRHFLDLIEKHGISVFALRDDALNITGWAAHTPDTGWSHHGPTPADAVSSFLRSINPLSVATKQPPPPVGPRALL